MVVDLQLTTDLNHNGYCRDHLTVIKENFRNSTEVTFNVKDDTTRRKRLTTISSEISDVSQDSYSSVLTYKEKKKIPDGGYGWIIVFASLMISLIADGVSFSFGLLYSELLDYFNEGTTKTAWVGSLFMSVPLISGPIMSNLVDKYGCRKMTMIGGLFGCAGFVLSAISDSIEMLFVTFGIIAGLGLGVIYVTAVVSIAFWFEAKRTFATGIGASGTGIGTFLYAPFTQWLISYYGWRGATLILGGTLLNFCVFGALMIDPEWLIEENKLEARSQSIQTFSNSSMCLDEIKKLIETGAPKEDLLETLVTNVNTEANQQIQDPNIAHSKKYQSEVLLPTFISSNEIVNLNDLKSISRRSLHPNNLISPEKLSQHSFNIQIITSNKDDSKKTADIDNFMRAYNVEKQNSNNNKIKSDDSNNNNLFSMHCKIASMETLNTSEKVTSTDRDVDFSSISLDHDDNLECHSLIDFDEEMCDWRRNGIHGSRFSLNDKIFAKTPCDDSIRNEIKQKFRGNSLNILNNEEMQLLNCKDSFIMPYNKHLCNYKNIEKGIQSKNFSKKQQPTIKIHGNLKKNSSLRYSNYLKNMRVHRNSIHYRGAMLNTHRYRLKASSCPNIYRNSMTTIAKEDNDVWYDDFVDIIKSIFDFSLFLQYKFGMMSLSTLFLFVCYIIPYFYITELLLDLDYTEEASAYLISVIGIFNTIGMVALGWIGDQRWCNVTKTYAFCLCLCGISMFAIPLATWSYKFLMLLSAIFGVTFGSSFSFTPMITSKLVDMEDFTLAYGLILLVQGIGSLVGPPLAGLIFDITGRWDFSFYIGGFMVVFSGFLAYIIGSIHTEYEDVEYSNNNQCKKVNHVDIK